MTSSEAVGSEGPWRRCLRGFCLAIVTGLLLALDGCTAATAPSEIDSLGDIGPPQAESSFSGTSSPMQTFPRMEQRSVATTVSSIPSVPGEPSPAVPAPSGGDATVTTAQGPGGDYLVDRHGWTLYLFDHDPANESTCGQPCIGEHPPLVTSGEPSAGDGTNSNLLGVTTRADGTGQVSYGGHPLYYFSGDSGAGAMNGEGEGNLWWMVTPQGVPIKDVFTSLGAG